MINYLLLTLSIAFGTAIGFTLANILTIYFSERVDDKGHPVEPPAPPTGPMRLAATKADDDDGFAPPGESKKRRRGFFA